jgi:crotonobetainyl-CoA:carnitine CoA-transferase CaiB-like acyl-CoA transferase
MLSGFFEVDGVRLLPDSGLAPLEDPEALASLDKLARPEPAEPPPTPSLPLQGLRVLDFGVGGVGVEGGRMLAEYGADVIKIETRTYPDFMRFITGTPMNPSFASSSRSKRGLGVNAKHTEGLEVLYRLISSADAIIENSSTGTMASLQLDFDSVHGVNPRTVMVSSQLLGSKGPWADWIGYGPSTQPIAGLFSLWDYDDDDPPAGSTSIMPDHLAGRVLALGAVAGLLSRERTGQGCHVEVAQVEVAAAMIGDQLLKAALAPGSVRPQGNRRPDGAPWGAYPCAGEEEWCVITVRHDDDWNALLDAMGRPDWGDSPGWESAEGRREAHDDIDKLLTEWTSQRPKSEVAALLQRFGVPCGPMLTGSDQLDDPHLLAHRYPRPIDQQGLGPLTLEGPCFTASGMSEPVITQAPLLGQHTVEICRDILGYPESEIQRLVDSGALEQG